MLDTPGGPKGWRRINQRGEVVAYQLSTYLCERRFSTLLGIGNHKTKKHNFDSFTVLLIIQEDNNKVSNTNLTGR